MRSPASAAPPRSTVWAGDRSHTDGSAASDESVVHRSCSCSKSASRGTTRAGRLGDVVVAALGTNDSGLFDHDRLHRNWAEALRLTGERPVVFLSTQARPGSAQLNRQRTYSDALRAWCASEERCVLADWANTPAAVDPASYIDSVHLTEAGTRARAQFIADVVAALITGRPIPNPPIPNP